MNSVFLENAEKLKKKTDIYIYEGFAKDIMELRKTLREQVLEYQKPRKIHASLKGASL